MGRTGKQVARRIGDLRKRAHFFKHFLRPLDQFGDVGILKRVLETAARLPPPDRDVLGRLHEQVYALDPGDLRPQPIDDLGGRERALFAGHQRDKEAGRIRRLGVAVAARAADLRSEPLDVGVAQEHVAQLALQPHHLGGGNLLRRLRHARKHPGVLDRKEALRNRDAHGDSQHQSGQEYRKGDRLVAQRNVERAPVAGLHGVKTGFDNAIKTAVSVRPLPQKARAQHRRKRQRYDGGNHDRRRDGDGEFAKQAPKDPAHEKQRDENRDQRQTDGQHGEPDFTRADQCSLEGRHAVLKMAVDVLDFNDRIVDNETDRDRKRHQRQIVEAEIEHVHRGERAKERQHDGEGRHQCRPHVAQEQQNHQDNETHRQGERELDIGDRGANGGGAVQDGADGDCRRNIGRELRHQRLDLIDRVDHVGARLLEDRKHDRRRIVVVGGGKPVGPGGDGPADIAHPDRGAVAVCDNDVVERSGRLRRSQSSSWRS